MQPASCSEVQNKLHLQMRTPGRSSHDIPVCNGLRQSETCSFRPVNTYRCFITAKLDVCLLTSCGVTVCKLNCLNRGDSRKEESVGGDPCGCPLPFTNIAKSPPPDGSFTAHASRNTRAAGRGVEVCVVVMVGFTARTFSVCLISRFDVWVWM